LAESPRGTVFDAELVAFGSREGRVVRDFAAVCRATLQGDVGAARALQLVAFDLLELAGDDLRPLAWVKRTGLLREVSPAGDRWRLVQSLVPAVVGALAPPDRGETDWEGRLEVSAEPRSAQ
jgi:ATP-dependent DNA ligase